MGSVWWIKDVLIGYYVIFGHKTNVISVNYDKMNCELSFKIKELKLIKLCWNKNGIEKVEVSYWWIV